MDKSKKILLIIPAYNEENTIEKIVNIGKKYTDICVVDDASRDSTPQILASIPGIHVIRHTINTHIPQAVLDGMKFAVDQRYSYSITMDAGLSHDPEEIPLFLNVPHSDLVIGTRVKRMKTPKYRRMLSFIGNFIYNLSLDFPRSLFKKQYYKDITSGFRRYSRNAMQLLLESPQKSRSFDFLMESMMYIYRKRLSIKEIPITYNFSNSSLNPRVVRDCLRMCLRSIFRRTSS